MKFNIMKLVILVSVALFQVQAQSQFDTYKQQVISLLDSNDYEILCLNAIKSSQIFEAIPVLENRFWNQSWPMRSMYLDVLAELKYGGTIPLGLALLDSAKKLPISELFSIQLDVTYSFLKMKNVSTINYLFEWLKSYHSGNSKYNYMIQSLLYLLQVPEYENIARQELLFICNNEKMFGYRQMAQDALVDKYGVEMLTLLLDVFNNDTSAYSRYYALLNILKLNYPGTESLIKNRIPLENEWLFISRYSDTLLSKYGVPENYNYLYNLYTAETNQENKYWLQSSLQLTHPPRFSEQMQLTSMIDSLNKYTQQTASFNWIRDESFIDTIKQYLTAARDKIMGQDSVACKRYVGYYVLAINKAKADTLTYSNAFVSKEAWNILYHNAQYILDRLPESPVNLNYNVKFSNSHGMLITEGSLQYYEGGWKEAISNGDGTFKVNTNQNKVSLRMNYEYGSQTLSNVSLSGIVEFKTVNTRINLQNSTGDPIDTGRVQYYAGGWRDFGSTSNGTTSKELLPGNYTFRMSYGYASNDKQQNTALNPVVVFNTVNKSVELRNSSGNLIDAGTVQYYAGGWRYFGTTSNGTASKELLPGNYTFRMVYGYASNDKQQNTASNPVVVFNTVSTSVELRNSAGNLIDLGTVQYYAGAWRDFGITSGGIVSKELLPANYTFRITHEFISNDKQQNTGTNSTVTFSTTACTARVTRQGQRVNNAAIKYYAGGWRDFGLTSNGEAVKELLPANLTFRAVLNGIQQDKSQNTGTNTVIEFVLP